MILKSQHRCFGGTVAYYRHFSVVCQSEMNFAVFIPPQAQERSVPILYYLSGLTCTEENFTVKAGAQRYAAEWGLMLVAPDTSPRQTGIVNEDETWDLGSGAGFYVDALLEPWRSHYQMFSYVTEELPPLIHAHFPVNSAQQGIMGHSMGGHGALVCALRKPSQYQSVSAIAPIAAPMRSPWGQKAFRAYLGEDREQWKVYDASELVRSVQHPSEILIDQGTGDEFYPQLMPEYFAAQCQMSGQRLNLRLQAGYDHGYFMVATVIGDHLRHHAQTLGNVNLR
jgi:S-formylglutathione hydrolase